LLAAVEVELTITPAAVVALEVIDLLLLVNLPVVVDLLNLH
jgi:hypothetical protein